MYFATIKIHLVPVEIQQDEGNFVSKALWTTKIFNFTCLINVLYPNLIDSSEKQNFDKTCTNTKAW
jgi:hypothetical protein